MDFTVGAERQFARDRCIEAFTKDDVVGTKERRWGVFTDDIVDRRNGVTDEFNYYDGGQGTGGVCGNEATCPLLHYPDFTLDLWDMFRGGCGVQTNVERCKIIGKTNEGPVA